MTRKCPPIHRLILLSTFVVLLNACGGGGGGGATPTPTPPVNYHSLAAGGASGCRINGSTGALSCWGQNDMGQLGIGNTTTPIYTPTAVNLGTGISAKQVAIGIDHACAILNDNSVSCWGNNSAGQLGQPLSIPSLSSPLVVSGILAKAIALGFEHTCVITQTDAVQCWGSNAKGQLGQGQGTLQNSSTPQTISALTAKSIKSGYHHLCAIASDDSVKCWGDNQYGQLGNGTNTDSPTVVGASGLSGVIALAAGSYHSCAATASAVSCWGRNDAGQLGTNGTSNLNLPTLAGTTSAGVSQLVAGLAHTCVLSTNIGCWGSNASSQLSGSTAGGNSLVVVTLPVTSHSLVAGLSHTCAQGSDNQTYCWGAGSSGRLGPNAVTNAAIAVTVP